MFNFPKISIILIAIFCHININAQELPSGLDPSFLQSLPEEVQQDLLNRINAQSDLEETQYRRPSTFIEKPEPTSDRFGAQVFSMMQSTLMPINEPNFDGSYILDFGDELELQLIGQEASTERLLIERDGSVNIEDIGKIFLSGLSLDDASELIRAKVEQTFIGVKSFISLTNVRDIQIIVIGDVYNPGVYTLNGNSTIFHGLSVSGGPSLTGSFRKIDLIRNNKVLETIDLYQTFIFGKSSFDKRLRSGDTIFVHPVKNVVAASGAFKRPGVYELLDTENLYTLTKYANNLNAYADTNNIRLQRILDGKVTPIKINTIDQLQDIEAKDADNLFVRSFPFRNVTINGAVTNPGTYLMNEGETINDVIRKAGGFLKNAYPFGGVYENQFTFGVNAQANKVLYDKFLQNIFELMSIGTQTETNQIGSLLDLFMTLRDAPVSGRVVVNFLDRSDANAMLVNDGDIITIPEYQNQVYLYGELSSEGAAEFVEGEDAEYYIKKVGGLNNFADNESIFIYQPNGESFQYSKNRNLFQSQNEKIEIYSGTIIYVPRKVNNEYITRLRTQAYASILSGLAVSLASVSVLGSN